ncbi:MAG: D-aminoacyl-tRNA deacylase [Bacteroidia bacterium]|nr:D-aminoacyl-tRNA deacylase [Bacteroidia bacterium]
MRVVIQRVSEASVTIDEELKSSIKQGLLVLAGFETDDKDEDLEWTCKKITQLRIFNDLNGVMNLSVKDIEGEILAVSQFTLHAKTRKGNRPSYINAAPPDISIRLYHLFVETLSENLGIKVQTGEFGAHMVVRLINDGPVTIIIDSKNKDL